MRRISSTVIGVVALSLAACQAKVATVEVAPPTISFDTDAAVKPLVLTLKDDKGEEIHDPHLAIYTSADPKIARVDDKGVVKPSGTGKTTITVKVEEATATVPVTVVLLKRIQLQSPALVVVAGTSSETLRVDYMNERGEQLEVDLEKRPDWKVVWKVQDAAVASVDDKGVVTGIAAGTTTLTASVGDLKSELKLTVNPAPEPEPETPPEPEPVKKGKKGK